MPRNKSRMPAKAKGVNSFDIPSMTEEQKTTFIIAGAVVAYMFLMGAGEKVPGWVKELPPTNPRTNGAWRGKGSYGRAPFGTQVSHRR